MESMLSALQERIAPIFKVPTKGWLDRPRYERLLAEVTGGRLAAAGYEQHFFDTDYGELGQVEWSVSKKSTPWVDSLRVIEAVREGFSRTLYFGFVRYDDWVECVSLSPLLDVRRMLALGELERLLLAHVDIVRANTARRTGWPRGHISLHRTIEDAHLAETLAGVTAGFSGLVRFQARLDYYERTLASLGIPCAVYDPASATWAMRP